MHTCKQVAPPVDVASFFRDLLVMRSLLNETALRAMESFETLNYGWAKGTIRYVREHACLLVACSTHKRRTWRYSGGRKRRCTPGLPVPPRRDSAHTIEGHERGEVGSRNLISCHFSL
jgi:hypothetical protein